MTSPSSTATSPSIHDMRKRDMDRISKDDYYSVFQFRMVAVDVGFINILEDIVHFGSFGIANCRACYFLSLRPVLNKEIT